MRDVLNGFLVLWFLEVVCFRWLFLLEWILWGTFIFRILVFSLSVYATWVVGVTSLRCSRRGGWKVDFWFLYWGGIVIRWRIFF